tara:strand:+ start:594 stop:1010 length:417 start_codon:yes stop_codon:yes gene_type:complete
MIGIFSYIIKILISITSTYFLVYFFNKDTKIDFIDIIKFNFVSVLLLSPAFYISIEYNSMIFYSMLILLLYFYIYKNIESNLSFLYIFSLIIAILIACNYILYTLIGVAFYIFFSNNIIDLIKDDSQSYLEDDKNTYD